MKKQTCPKCRHYDPTLQITTPDNTVEKKRIDKTNYLVSQPITSIIKEGPGTCSIKTQNGEVKHLKFKLTPNCKLGSKGLQRGRCSKYEPKEEEEAETITPIPGKTVNRHISAVT